jgi:hypothetical protein
MKAPDNLSALPVIILAVILLISTAAAETKVKTFTEVGSHTWQVPSGVEEVKVLVVGGGGGGGYAGGTNGDGGGGAGGLVYDSDRKVSDDVSIYVGDGGSPNSDGEDSSFGSIVAKGGGAGGDGDEGGHNGGSGGGGGQNSNSGGSSTQPNTNSNVDVDAGHSGAGGTNNDVGGGGGGAGDPGQSGYGDHGSDGGDGLYFGDVFGDEYGENGYFAGGGAGGENDGDCNGGCGADNFGGMGGGGDSPGNSAPEDGMPNTGGGGGGTSLNEISNPASGGSGVVIVKYEAGKSLCDRRGPFNECISNQTHQIGNQIINISSIFTAEDTTTIEALSGPSKINVTNSSTISGLWIGNIEIYSNNPSTIKPGAEFRPENGRILID